MAAIVNTFFNAAYDTGGFIYYSRNQSIRQAPIHFVFEIYVRFFLDKNECSIYNKSRTKIRDCPTALKHRRNGGGVSVEGSNMTGTTLFFVLIGVGVASANLVRLIDILDTPPEYRKARRHA